MLNVSFAFFDFDDTLTRGDSIVPFLLFARKRGLMTTGQLLRACTRYLGQLLDRRKTVEAKEIALSFVKGRTYAEMEAFCRDFFSVKEQYRFLERGKEELRRLKEAGYRIVVVSASADLYMHLLPEFLPVDAVISTVCEIDGNGCYTGRILQNCKGEAKPVMLNAWLQAQGLTLDRRTARAYGDSAGDRFLLRMTDHPVLVDPSRSLRKEMPSAEIARWH